MPLDGAMLSQVKQEIETAVGARVDRAGKSSLWRSGAGRAHTGC